MEWLSEKQDDIRYQSLLLLQYRAQSTEDVYPYWDIFCAKLLDDNSYQRNIGLVLISENARWDRDNKLSSIIDSYLSLLNDEKPITVRICIQSLANIVPYASWINQKITGKLMALDLTTIRETMRKLVLTDILTILIQIRKEDPREEIDSFIMNALTGEILDKKAKKQIEAML